MMYLQVEHVNDDDSDYLKFNGYHTAMEYIASMVLDYDGQPGYNFVLSTQPVGLPESEYTLTN
jgi:hypothetical protein